MSYGFTVSVTVGAQGIDLLRGKSSDVVLREVVADSLAHKRIRTAMCEKKDNRRGAVI